MSKIRTKIPSNKSKAASTKSAIRLNNDNSSLIDKKVIEVIAKPNSPKSHYFFDEQKNAFVFYVKAQAEDGRANEEILKMIKKETKKDAKIISGATSRKKLIKID